MTYVHTDANIVGAACAPPAAQPETRRFIRRRSVCSTSSGGKSKLFQGTVRSAAGGDLHDLHMEPPRMSLKAQHLSKYCLPNSPAEHVRLRRVGDEGGQSLSLFKPGSRCFGGLHIHRHRQSQRQRHRHRPVHIRIHRHRHGHVHVHIYVHTYPHIIYR